MIAKKDIRLSKTKIYPGIIQVRGEAWVDVSTSVHQGQGVDGIKIAEGYIIHRLVTALYGDLIKDVWELKTATLDKVKGPQARELEEMFLKLINKLAWVDEN